MICTSNTFLRKRRDLGRYVTDAILEWERDNPGREVREIHWVMTDEILDPAVAIKATVADVE